MAKTSIYLPDDLAEQVRAHGIPVSEVAQTALRQAVRDAEIKENVMTDLQAVAERLHANRGAVTEADQARAAKVQAWGDKWARTAASADDLEYVVTFSDAADDFRPPVSLISFAESETQREHRAAGRPGMPGSWDVPTSPDDRYWPDFRRGAREIWNAVSPLLDELDKRDAAPDAGAAKKRARIRSITWDPAE